MQKIQVLPAEKHPKTLEAAIKTMRKTGMFGKVTRVNVEYPTASDLLQMAKNIPTKIIDLRHKTADGKYDHLFGAFQVILSNGVSSPVFSTTDTNDSEMRSFNIPNYSLVKRVNGTEKGNWLRCLSFNKKDGTEITKVETQTGKPIGPEFVIADSEEIIGIYGWKNDEAYSNLGFIVWQPPRL